MVTKYLSDKDRMISEGDVRLHISPGNPKMGPIRGMNLLPVETCPGHTPGCKSKCYALKGIDFRSNMRNCWRENTEAWRDHRQVAARLMSEWLQRHKPELFRIHGSGDFMGQPHFKSWERIALENPDTLFYAFSKSPFCLASRADNLRVRRSVWHDTPTCRLRLDSVPRAYVEEMPEMGSLLSGPNDPPNGSHICEATVSNDVTCWGCRWCMIQGWEEGKPVVFREH